MKKITILSLLVTTVFIVNAQDKANPLIKNYGPVLEVPANAEMPDAKLNYKILIDIVSAPSKPDSINDALENAARLMNLHVAGGVDAKKLHVIIVIHNAAAFSLLNNAAYQLKYHMDNPNAALITALHDAGAKIVICGQTMARRNIEPTALSSEATVALSALTTLTAYQLKGYALIKF